MAEAHHAAIAQDQVEADRRDRQDHDAGEQRHQERSCRSARSIDRQQRENRQQRGHEHVARGEPARSFARRREQAFRPEHQHDRHQHVDQHRGQRRPGARAGAVADEMAQRSGRNARPMVSIRPTMMAATNAPRIEPMPPMMITTKARIRMFSPMPICTDEDRRLHQAGEARRARRRARTPACRAA